MAIAVNRSKRTFTERDRQVLQVLRPPLAHAYLQLRERTATLISALELGLEDRLAAVIQLDRFGKAAYISTLARELLAAYFGPTSSSAAGLPARLSEWIDGCGRHRPLIVDGPRGRLHVRELEPGAPQRWRALLLQEQQTGAPSVESLQAFGLTRRQAHVLRLVACGKRNEQIAHELFISVATVRKHLEHIYQQLGVRSRAEAIARTLGASG